MTVNPRIFDENMDSYTQKLRVFLSSFFRQRGIEAYYHNASETANYPYVVYELRHIGSLTDDESAKRYNMEINAYTKSDMIFLERLIDFLEEELGGLKVNTSIFFLTSQLAYGRLPIAETEPLKRIRVNFELKYFWKGRC